ncbi:Hypothetical Protein sle_30140 [Streptomyces leeuwenhoekii]|uniref:Uncharacterized protein n=1 Tax=Streptomyces leeuwenhoekii TaxID=1437453 RepID=A0A0F7VRS5_STRLW|nr:Hypothetical Protein sle_30140 [Streptomyces leeuwenhoekii]
MTDSEHAPPRATAEVPGTRAPTRTTRKPTRTAFLRRPAGPRRSRPIAADPWPPTAHTCRRPSTSPASSEHLTAASSPATRARQAGRSYREAVHRRTPYAPAPTASTPAPAATEAAGRETATTTHPTSPTVGTTLATGARSSVQADALATA